jgi:hypothetical protein
MCGAQMTGPSNRGGIPVKIVQLLCTGKLSHPSKTYHSAKKGRFCYCWLKVETSGSIHGLQLETKANLGKENKNRKCSIGELAIIQKKISVQKSKQN